MDPLPPVQETPPPRGPTRSQLLLLVVLAVLFWLVVPLLILILLLVPIVRADVPSLPDEPPCRITGKVYADPDPREVAASLRFSSSCRHLTGRVVGHALILSDRDSIVEIPLPHAGGWHRFGYRWLGQTATIEGKPVAVLRQRITRP